MDALISLLYIRISTFTRNLQQLLQLVIFIFSKMGKKKKKGLSNRLAKMTDEERIRYLQARAAIEEEARRRKEQLISTFIKVIINYTIY